MTTGRIQFHYTIIDFATRWVSGDPVAATDVTEAAWAPLDALDEYGLWSEAHRVIAIARELVPLALPLSRERGGREQKLPLSRKKRGRPGGGAPVR